MIVSDFTVGDRFKRNAKGYEKMIFIVVKVYDDAISCKDSEGRFTSIYFDSKTLGTWAKVTWMENENE